ncbi:MAG TPA: hypothetical protein VKQ11_20750, partial [Candidatus Sulfotelmatobacter sp.]|nr:hypothetical protein [Candidatus Sulfotelmatobacter sp.]
MRISKHLKGIAESQIMPMKMIQVQADGKQFTLSIGARSRALHFPRDMVPLLRCNTDAGELSLAEELRADADGILNAVLRCKICGADYRIEDGIACLLPDQLSSEARHEMRIRDTIDYDCTNPSPFVPPSEGWRS